MILFERGVPLLMPNKFGARGIHTAAREGHLIIINQSEMYTNHVRSISNHTLSIKRGKVGFFSRSVALSKDANFISMGIRVNRGQS